MSGSQNRNHSRPDMKYHGLINQGSTCYLNSVLQVLFMTEDFREAVLTFSERHPHEDSFIDGPLTELFTDLKSHTARTVGVTQKLGIDRVYEQSDAAEYFEKILRQASPYASQIFQGHLSHTTVCSGCKTRSGEPGPFWSLPLALLNSCSKDYSVVEGVQNFFKDSNFSGENQLYCETCSAKHNATARYEIEQHPEVLTLLLKRFEFDYYQMSYVKNSCAVIVPWILTIPENQTYEIYGFVEHFGSLRGGHYTATIKSRDRWYTFNDSTVRLLRNPPFRNHNTTEKSDTAYLLFYRKKDLGDVDNVEVHPSDTNENYLQHQHAEEVKKSNEIISSLNAREGSSDAETQNSGAQSKHRRSSQNDSRGGKGFLEAEEDEHRERKRDDTRANKRRKIEETVREGKNGQNEQGHARRIEGKKENIKAEGLASTKAKESKSLKDSKEKASVGSGEQNMQKNHGGCKEETGSSEQTKHHGGKKVDTLEGKKPEMRVNNQSQRETTSVREPGVEGQGKRRPGDGGEKQTKRQVNKNDHELNRITEEPLLSHKESEVKRGEEQEATGNKKKKDTRFRELMRSLFKRSKKKRGNGNTAGVEDGGEANFKSESNAKKKSDEPKRADGKKKSEYFLGKQSGKMRKSESKDRKKESCVLCLPFKRKQDDSED